MRASLRRTGKRTASPEHSRRVWLAAGQTEGNWTDALDLKVGDQIGQADGTTGVVQAVKVVPVQQRMYNLTVAEAHTFFVGRGQWLAHNAGPCPSLSIPTEQFGKKIGKHAQDYGLDPNNPAHRNWLQNHIEDIGQNYEQVRQGAWNPNGGGASDYFFFQKGRDVVISQSDGTFVTILKDGINNKWFSGANILE